MTRESRIILSIADRFTQPLQAYAAGTEKAVKATEQLAAAGKQGSDAAARMAQASQGTAQAHDKAATAANQQVSTLQNLRTSLLLVTGTAVAFGVAAKQAFEFGQQGAAITQTTESFERMVQITGGASDTLNRLRTAARGTVDDLTLMANVQTLLAGTSGQLSSAFINAAPQLLEIAKAAQKVNPTLGDTNFLFESIARGIKRSSPLILDNLGIVVKLGPAYDDYAKSIGKATDELSAEEKQIALLNAVLAQGNVLMQQAGGAADSATDAYSRWTAQTANLTNQMKMLAGTVLGPVVDASATNLQGINLANEAYREGKINLAQYAFNMGLMLTPLGIFTDELDLLTNHLARQAHNQASVNREVAIAAAHTPQLADQVRDASAVTDAYSARLQGLADAYGAVATRQMSVDALQRAELERAAAWLGTYEAAEAALRRMNIPLNERVRLEQELALLTGQLTQEELARQEAVGFLTKQLELGNVTQAQYLEWLGKIATGALAARDAISAIGAAIAALPPSGTTWEYTVNTYNVNHDVNVSEPGPGVGPLAAPGPDDVPGAPGTAFAAGGRGIVPLGFFGDSYRMRAEQGEEVIVRTPRQQREGTNGGGGGLTIMAGAIVVNAAAGQSEELIAEFVLAKLARHYRGVVQSGAHRMGA